MQIVVKIIFFWGMEKPYTDPVPDWYSTGLQRDWLEEAEGTASSQARVAGMSPGSADAAWPASSPSAT